MVRGLEQFKAHFAGYSNKYVLIGGTACSVALEDVGIDFRVTKDLDIVLCVEVLESDFVAAFWDFIQKGGYKHQQKASGKRQFYRFISPDDGTFPTMLELFSRKPDLIILGDHSHLTPLPLDEEISSLSAILLDDDYYGFIQSGKIEIDRLPIVGPTHLIPLKAKAWLDLKQRRKSGAIVDEKDIRKHKNDILRLYQLLPMRAKIVLPTTITHDMEEFFKQLAGDPPTDLKMLGLKNTNFGEILDNMRRIYGLSVF
jgi:hypothetical protein